MREEMDGTVVDPFDKPIAQDFSSVTVKNS